MSVRFLSRLSIAAVVTASAVALAACNGGASNGGAPAPAPVAAETAAATVTPSEHGPGQFLFKQVEALDLRDDQRAAITELRANLHADLAPHREVLRQVARGLADGIEAGKLDPAVAAAHQAALTASLADAKLAFANAMNGVHDTLDEGQRIALVAKLQALHEGRAQADAEGGEHQGPLARLALQVGLSEEQKASLKQSFQDTADEIFPDRKARREAHEAQMKAIAVAFVSDDFDAQNFDPWTGADHPLESFGTVATRSIEISERILSESQRKALAELVREHAAHI